MVKAINLNFYISIFIVLLRPLDYFEYRIAICEKAETLIIVSI